MPKNRCNFPNYDQNFIFTFLLLAYLIKPIQAEEITLSALLHLSGNFAMEGAAFREGIEFGLEDANRELSQKNITLKVDFQDTRFTPIETVTLAHMATQDNKSRGLIVSTYPEIKPIASIVEQNKTPAIVLWDATPEIDNFGDYIFSIGPWAPDTGEKSARFSVNKLKAKRVFILYQQVEWSEAVKTYYTNKITREGVEYKTLGLQPIETDFKTILAKVRAFKPNVVYAPIVFGLTPFVKQYKIYIKDIPLIMSDNLTEHTIQKVPKAFEGVYHSAVADPDNVVSTKLKEQYTNKYHKAPGLIMFNAWGYDAILMYKEAIMKGARTREEIKDAMYQIKNLQGATGDITVNSKGSSPKYISMFQVKNSKLELVENPDPE